MAHQADIPEGKGERVLVVDDEPRIVGFIERWLDDLGYQVRVATRPEAALELLRAEPDQYDLVMTDYLMPGMNGLELAARVRQVRQDLPILMTTGFVGEIPDEIIQQAGVTLVIQKPVFMRPLATKLRELLDGTGSREP
jgi:CheY-like chemotaxis protein